MCTSKGDYKSEKKYVGDYLVFTKNKRRSTL